MRRAAIAKNIFCTLEILLQIKRAWHDVNETHLNVVLDHSLGNSINHGFNDFIKRKFLIFGDINGSKTQLNELSSFAETIFHIFEGHTLDSLIVHEHFLSGPESVQNI